MIRHRFSTIVSIFGLFLLGWRLEAATVMQKALQPNQPGSPSGNTTPQQNLPIKSKIQPGVKTSDEATRVTFTHSAPQWISWGYLRAYQPAVVSSLLGSVKSG